MIKLQVVQINENAKMDIYLSMDGGGQHQLNLPNSFNFLLKPISRRDAQLKQKIGYNKFLEARIKIQIV